jgi:hypothetical protein
MKSAKNIEEHVITEIVNHLEKGYACLLHQYKLLPLIIMSTSNTLKQVV